MSIRFYTSVIKYGNSLLYRGYVNGMPDQRKIKFKPKLYVPSEKGDKLALDGIKVAEIKFDSMDELKEFSTQYKDVPNFKIYGNKNCVAQFLQEQFPSPIKFDIKSIKVGNYDIEVYSKEGFPEPSSASYPITSICYYNSSDGKFYTWAYKDDYKPKHQNVIYHKCKDEKDLLLKFVNFFNDPLVLPDIITGWNTRFFDTPYTINRIRKVLGEDYVKKMSPWGIVNEKNITVNGISRQFYDIVGVTELDYIEIFKKFTANTLGTQETYKLDHIANVVLGERKLSYDEYEGLHDLYEKNFEKFIDYNIRDVDLVKRIDEKLGLISLVCTMAYRAGVNYTDTLGTVGIWDSIIYRVLCSNDIVIPPETGDSKSDYPGGYVKDPQKGLHKWIMSFDLNSLYPHLIMQANMSPETSLDEMVSNYISVDTCLSKQPIEAPKDVAIAPNGALFSKKNQGIIPKIIEQYYADRKNIKKQMLTKEQELENVKAELAKRGLL